MINRPAPPLHQPGSTAQINWPARLAAEAISPFTITERSEAEKEENPNVLRWTPL
jgi:hypothetical protein